MYNFFGLSTKQEHLLLSTIYFLLSQYNTAMKSHPKIALIADWITDAGGAENVFMKLMQMYPDADIYTSVFFQEDNPAFAWRTVFTSFIQNIPLLSKRHKLAMLLRPIAFESFDLSGYDIVISSSSAESKWVITPPETKHICYCHTPTRYLWSHAREYKQYLEFGWLNPLAKLMMHVTFPRLRRWDQIASMRPDIYIANSQNTADRIKKYYHRESDVIYPFFTTLKHWNTETVRYWEYYFAIGRCIPYKKFDLLVDTFNENGKQLKIATATDTKLYRKLRKKSQPNIQWIFGASDEEVATYFIHARAYLMPQEEDFGITPIESMSHGTPVIAYRKWGATETIIENQTGLFFDKQSFQSLQESIDIFETMHFDPDLCRLRAKEFTEEVFEKKIKDLLGKVK